MMMRGFVATAATALCLVAGSALADPKADIQAKSKHAMESYDLMDYEAAKKQLNQALAISKKAKLDKDPVTAHIYLDLGIAAFANADAETAKVAFMSAVQIDAKIKIDAAYKSPELDKLLEEARSEASGGASGGGETGGNAGGVDCTTVKGFQHTILETGTRGAPQPIEVLIGSDLKVAKVAVHFRAEGATDFTELKLTPQGACKYTGQIPAAAMKGSLVHYFVAAYAADSTKPLAGKGSSGSPNIMELSGAATTVATRGDGEDPLGKGGGAVTPPDGGDVHAGVVVDTKPARLFIGVTAGAGIGYVTGTTEGGNTVKNCCLGKDLFVVQPELGYYVTPQRSVGVAVRLGIPIGANVDGHATLAPAGLVRVRYGLGEGGEGVRVMGQIGAGILRNTITLDNPTAGMDTDIVAQGPLLLGGGVGFTKKLSGNIAFVVDISALAGIAVINHLGTAPNMTALNTGISADASIGISVGI